MVFVFSAPGFENYMRCDSVLATEKVVPVSPEEQKACAHEGHVIYKDLIWSELSIPLFILDSC